MLLARFAMNSAMTRCVSSTVAPGVWVTVTGIAAALGLDEMSSAAPTATLSSTSPVPSGMMVAVNTVPAPPAGLSGPTAALLVVSSPSVKPVTGSEKVTLAVKVPGAPRLNDVTPPVVKHPFRTS